MGLRLLSVTETFGVAHVWVTSVHVFALPLACGRSPALLPHNLVVSLVLCFVKFTLMCKVVLGYL